MFYFQARVEQSVPFHHLSSFSSYYGARLWTSHTKMLAIHESMPLAGYPENTCPACTQGISRTNPSLSCPGCPGPRPNLDSKPLHPESQTPCGARTSTIPASNQSVRKEPDPRQESNKSSKHPYPSMCSGQ